MNSCRSRFSVYLIFSFLFHFPAFAKSPFEKNLPRGLATFEKPVTLEQNWVSLTAPPEGQVRSLNEEWEEAESVMTLWNNASYIKALTENGEVTLLADDSKAQSDWKRWLSRNQISEDRISYELVPTDSIWVRDYGPWYILDGKNRFGIIDTTYNRPRPLDDQVPEALARKLNVPLFNPSLVHTGGNFYNDGYFSAFSSTLVFRENRNLSVEEIMNRVFRFLGVNRYITSPLGEQVTIEHLDTFGKLVAPDTWVFAQFEPGSRFQQDAERMVDILSKAKSAYGTPYRIFRMPMVKRSSWGGEDYRAYVNSFMSNGVLYYPVYGNDSSDKRAGQIYQQALPGWKIVGVDNGNTEWGDSVHCRSRNILKRNTIFIFPEVVQNLNQYRIEAQVIPSPRATLATLPVLQIEINGKSFSYHMTPEQNNRYSHDLDVRSGDEIAFYVRAEDSSGVVKSAPLVAPAQRIRWVVP